MYVNTCHGLFFFTWKSSHARVAYGPTYAASSAKINYNVTPSGSVEGHSCVLHSALPVPRKKEEFTPTFIGDWLKSIGLDVSISRAWQ